MRLGPTYDVYRDVGQILLGTLLCCLLILIKDLLILINVSVSVFSLTINLVVKVSCVEWADEMSLVSVPHISTSEAGFLALDTADFLLGCQVLLFETASVLISQIVALFSYLKACISFHTSCCLHLLLPLSLTL